MVLLLLSAAALGFPVVLPRLARPYAGPPAWPGAVTFSGERAWADLGTLATRFPRRWSGGPDRQAAAHWLADRLTRIGLEGQRETFRAWMGGPSPTVLENIWALSPGTDRRNEIVVLVGNYDMAPTSFQAASDTAGHVATILELARVLTAVPHRRTLLFLFPDGEEWGMLGARHFVRTYPQRRQIVAALSIEDLDPGPLAALGIDGIGQFRGFAPAWLRALAADAALREGYRTDEVPPVLEWIQRSLLISSTDQGPFLGAGIPAIDLAGRTDDAVLKARVYHLPEDTIEHMQPASLLAYGRIQERIVRAIDTLSVVPSEESVYLRLGPGLVVPSWPLCAVQVVVFAPLAAALALRWRPGQAPPGVMGQEVLRAGAVLGVLLVWVVTIKLLPWLGLLPRYALYAPPPRHPLLTGVLWPAVVVSLAVLAAAALGGRLLLPRRPAAGPEEVEHRVGALLGVLALLVVVTLAANPFAAVTFLLPPALLWIWIRMRPSTLGRAANAVLVAGGFTPVVLLLAQYAATLQVGWYILWYVFLGIAYGQFTPVQVVPAFATLAVGIRLLAVGVWAAHPIHLIVAAISSATGFRTDARSPRRPG
ncbi:MAG: M28 family peptidase [Armatimonadota bacterium]|nr:M28 family peptidase [Armatimonadota bacterium]MDR7450924.1 M28 family peptidase [Armatimonadota bacterium]MDR7465846.1 M28 family peptidase [Armatimonadota bacterium]MDR7493754.1 M28 family peptidase [Armatimonadota bacterium]MDR7498360.1 M28 family peptidase [Armatimonadota bacterium]